MAYKLLIEKYGKIEKAEIVVAPITLLVGDNNSGKSYLLSLLWAFMSGEANYLMYKGLKELLVSKYTDIYSQIIQILSEHNLYMQNKKVEIREADIVNILNDLLDKNKNNIVRSIFNYEGMQIGKIQIESMENRTFEVVRKEESLERTVIKVKIDNIGKMTFNYPNEMDIEERITCSIFESLFKYILQNGRVINATHYLPAARTGFMLAKNTINQVGRKNTFDFVVRGQEEINDPIISPFPKPIIHFLNSLDNLDFEIEKKAYSDIVEWIIANMSHGDVECTDIRSKNFQYIPNDGENGIPLRATSGVVTELTPLILLLKYGRSLHSICYEEPEMCLHPQLQLDMAKLLIRMVNKGINIIATTHSDIIIQHINNVCQLNSISRAKDILEELNLEEDDLIDINKVMIYQFEDDGRSTRVQRITPYNNRFEVSSFVDALGEILEQSINISEVVDSEEE